MVLSEKRGSNPRPRPWQGRALPTELFSHVKFYEKERHIVSDAEANLSTLI